MIDLIRRLAAMIVCGTIKIVVRVTATCDISGPGRRNAIWKDGWMHDVWEYLSALNVSLSRVDTNLKKKTHVSSIPG